MGGPVGMEAGLLNEPMESIGSGRRGFVMADVTEPEETERYVKVAVDRFTRIRESV
jgi:hypothetical protein